MAFSLFNSLTKNIREVQPLSKTLQLFMCGPTVYGSMHAGHAKTYTQLDFLVKYMNQHFPVHYLMNITDVDDKIIAKAYQNGASFEEVALFYENEFFADMAWLGNGHPDTVARASDFIPEIIDQIKRLIEKGFAYQLEDGWYFDSLKARSHHSLASNPVAIAGDDSKKHASSDFALWKNHKPGEPFWDSSLGKGRPGWHIEDTAITEKLFGEQYDMHGGAIDLIFPHHEAEIAIMETLSGKTPVANHWTHTGLLLVDGAKMSKSQNNFVTVSDLKEKWDALTLRYMFFSSHYRSSSEVTDTALSAAEGARKRVEAFYRNVAPNWNSGPLESLTEKTRKEFYSKLDDDFNTPEALKVLFSYIRTIYQDSSLQPGKASKDFLEEINTLFSLFEFKERQLTPELEQLIETRNRLRKAKQFVESDQVRDQLNKAGIQIEDSPQGTIWYWSK